MIKSCYLNPKFLRDISENETIFNKFFDNFFLENKKNAKETLFLLEDKKIGIKEEYKKILYELAGQNHKMHILINDFLLKLNFEEVIIEDYFEFTDIIFDSVKDIQKSVELKIPYLEFPTTEKKFERNIQSLSRFAKKITLFDPNIIEHLTNFSNKGVKNVKENLEKIKKGEVGENFKPKIINPLDSNLKKKNFNYIACYKTSLQKILQIIFSVKKNDIKIEILTSIKDNVQRDFTKLIKYISKEIEETEDTLIKEKIKILNESIKSTLVSKVTDENILSNNYETILLKCFSKWKGIEVKIKNDWNVDGDQFYRRGMLVEGQNVRAVICFGKGLNVYEIQHKKGPRLRKERNYRLKLIDNPNEKKTYTIQTNHSNFPKFEQKVRFY